jgi:hypothetical protein
MGTPCWRLYHTQALDFLPGDTLVVSFHHLVKAQGLVFGAAQTAQGGRPGITEQLSEGCALVPDFSGEVMRKRWQASDGLDTVQVVHGF